MYHTVSTELYNSILPPMRFGTFATRSLRALLGSYRTLPLWLIIVGGPSVARGDESALFGQSTQSEAALIGVLYDTKQSPYHKPTTVGVGGGYTDVMAEFINKGWDEEVLNRFYRVTKPLYTTQIFIPNMNADNAPKAFGAEKTVMPSGWFVHYKGQVSPPESGDYRFWGCCDDVIAVAVNGKTVMIGNRFDSPLPTVKWKQSEPNGAQAADDFLVPGDWMTLKQTDIIDLDVIIGERPGGLFNAFLMIEKRGASYMKDKQGHSIFPIFQVAPYNTPAHHDPNWEPDFAEGFPSWKSYQ